LDQWKSVRNHILSGDFYPLTPYSSENDTWLAWQFDRPEQKVGMIQVFRRDHSNIVSKTFHLNCLNPSAQYELVNFDVEGSTKISGKELIEKGLRVEIKEKPGAVVITYKELK
jgi:alpha-galactosidase